MHHAATNGFSDIVRYLLDNSNIDLNICDRNGYTAADCAYRFGLEEVSDLRIRLPVICFFSFPDHFFFRTDRCIIGSSTTEANRSNSFY